MSIDKMIKIKMLELSKKYDISLVEIQKIKDGAIGRTITFNYCLLNDENAIKKTKRFYNKRDLVSWLVCLN